MKSKCFYEKPYFFSIPELGFEGPFYVITLVQIRATQKSPRHVSSLKAVQFKED